MALTFTKREGDLTTDPRGTFTLAQLGPEYEFEYGNNNTVTIRDANYESYDTHTMYKLNFSDSEIFSCHFAMSDGTQEDYNADGNLKYWKIQRKVYRLIGNGDRVCDTSMYDEGDITYCDKYDNSFPYKMKLTPDDKHWLHFEWLSADGRMEEIMNQCESNNIVCTIRARLKNGKCVEVKTR